MSLDLKNLLKGDLNGKLGSVSSDVVLANKVVAVYFSAHWCPPCRNFTPMLKEFYNELKSMGASFEIVFVSSDNSQQSFNEYYEIMPWLVVPYGDDRIKKLKSAAGIQGIPTLIFVDSNSGKVLHEDQDGTDIVYEGNMNLVLDWTL